MQDSDYETQLRMETGFWFLMYHHSFISAIFSNLKGQVRLRPCTGNNPQNF